MAVIPLRWTRVARTPNRAEPLNSWHREMTGEMSRLFDTFLNEWAGDEGESTKSYAFSPRAELIETEKEFKLNFELPGVDEKEVELLVEDNTLIVKGQKKSEVEQRDDKHHVYRSERSYGSFYRSIPFNTEIDENKVTANYSKGVLTVTVPKSAQAIRGAKKIEIKT